MSLLNSYAIFANESHPIFIEDEDLCCHIDNTTECGQFTYTHHNVAHYSASIELNIVSYDGCKCKQQTCDPSACSCCTRFGENYVEVKTTKCCKVLRYIFDDNLSVEAAPPVFECNSMCCCGVSCFNREVQNGVKLSLLIFNTGKDKCLGLKTLEHINKGQFVCEYAGEVLSLDEARIRISKLKPTDMNYIITVTEHFKSSDKTVTIVDPRNIGNAGRFINHSCDPNLVMVPIRCDSEVPMLALFALRDIETGEELTFHYSGAILSCSSGTSLCNTDFAQRKICFCQSEHCFRYLPFDSQLF